MFTIIKGWRHITLKGNVDFNGEFFKRCFGEILRTRLIEPIVFLGKRNGRNWPGNWAYFYMSFSKWNDSNLDRNVADRWGLSALKYYRCSHNFIDMIANSALDSSIMTFVLCCSYTFGVVWFCFINRECMCTKNYIEVEESKRVLRTTITYFPINALDTDWRNISHGRRSVWWFIARARSTVAPEHVQPVREYNFIRDTYITSFAKFSRRTGQTKPFDTL